MVRIDYDEKPGLWVDIKYWVGRVTGSIEGTLSPAEPSHEDSEIRENSDPEKTQLQMRIEASVKTGKTFHPDTHFIDLEDYANRPFVTNELYGRHISEEDVKTAPTYAEIRPAVQARLAQMEIGNDLMAILQKQSKLTVPNLYLKQFRNNHLMNKAVNGAISRHGGIGKLVFDDIAQQFINDRTAIYLERAMSHKIN